MRENLIQKIIHQLHEQHQLYFDFNATPQVEIERAFQRVESDFFVLLVKCERRQIRLYVKIGKEGNFRAGTFLKRLNAEYGCLESTYEHFKSRHMYSAVRPIAFFPEWRTIITAEVPGVVLKPLMMAHTSILSSHSTEGVGKIMFSCGRWLRDFHKHVTAATEFEHEGVALYVSRRLEILEEVGLIGTDLGRTLRQHLDQMEKAYISSLPSVLLHNDFISGNVLVDGERVCVLDYSWVGRGCNYYDVASFWVELQRLAEMPYHSRRKVSSLQKHFLEGYGAIDERAVEFKCFELLHRVNIMVDLWRKRQQAKWPSRIILDYERNNQLRWLNKFIKQL